MRGPDRRTRPAGRPLPQPCPGDGGDRRRRRRPTGGAIALLAALIVVASCGSRGLARSRPVTDTGQASRSVAPTWSRQPHSWGKLDEIERWLVGPDAKTAAPYWQVEAKLQLAEGRLVFAGPDRETSTDPRTLAFRRSAAREGFASVLSEPSAATASQLVRARDGARRVAGLGEPAAAAAAAEVPVSGLVRRAQWRAAPIDARNVRRASSRWNWITVHHSALEVGSTSLSASLDAVRGIQRVHQNSNGWADIGYHFLIDGAGRVIEGRALRWQGAHAGEAHNPGNVGICLLGNFELEKPTAAAVRSLERLTAELQRELRIPRRNVRPHRHWKETECPGRHLMPWFARF